MFPIRGVECLRFTYRAYFGGVWPTYSTLARHTGPTYLLTMRIAISGSHQTGKTTLAEALVAPLPNYTLVPEPYHDLAEDGEPFADIPDLDTFEQLFAASIATTTECDDNSILDRCPFDMLAYLTTHDEADRFDLRRWMAELQAAIQRLDLIVFVPIEVPDRIEAVDHRHLRNIVDAELRRLVLDDYLSFGVPAIEVTGSLRERVQNVLEHVKR